MYTRYPQSIQHDKRTRDLQHYVKLLEGLPRVSSDSRSDLNWHDLIFSPAFSYEDHEITLQ